MLAHEIRKASNDFFNMLNENSFSNGLTWVGVNDLFDWGLDDRF